MSGIRVVGVGLPRTGTTSLALAAIGAGLRTCHGWYAGAYPADVEACFDTPAYVDYPVLAAAHPGARFVLTLRDPGAWFDSVERALGSYLACVATAPAATPRHRTDDRCYRAAFGSARPDRATWVAAFVRHAGEARAFFRGAPERLLELDLHADPTRAADALAEFLGWPRAPLPHANRGTGHDWARLVHPLRRSDPDADNTAI